MACPSPATRTWRSPSLRVKLQLLICHDAGQEETVTDVVALNKHQQRIEHLGLKHCQLHEKSLIDPFLVRKADGRARSKFPANM
jgi:uncharacterized protein YqiB (DUF1249 family)